MYDKSFMKELCEEAGILLETFSHGYVLRLSKNGKTRHIFGSYWDINSAAVDRIACDKCACYLILTANNVPAIEHQLLNNPVMRQGWCKSTWLQALEYFEKHNQQVVIKPN